MQKTNKYANDYCHTVSAKSVVVCEKQTLNVMIIKLEANDAVFQRYWDIHKQMCRRHVGN